MVGTLGIESLRKIMVMTSQRWITLQWGELSQLIKFLQPWDQELSLKLTSRALDFSGSGADICRSWLTTPAIEDLLQQSKPNWTLPITGDRGTRSETCKPLMRSSITVTKDSIISSRVMFGAAIFLTRSLLFTEVTLTTRMVSHFKMILSMAKRVISWRISTKEGRSLIFEQIHLIYFNSI